MSDLRDPRVYFAAERTLLAWNRTSLTIMAFGFVVERFGLFMQLFAAEGHAALSRGASFWLGIAFILLGAGSAALAVLQYRKVLRTLRPAEIPEGYTVNAAAISNVLVALFGVALCAYLFWESTS
jgi:putative membrane protein